MTGGRLRWWHLLVIAAAVGLWAWSPWDSDPASVLPEDPDELILYSVHGTLYSLPHEERERLRQGEMLYGYPLLGKVAITDPGKRRDVLAAVRADLRGEGVSARCFRPRHVLRAVAGGRTVDLLICYECGNYKLYQDGELVRSRLQLTGTSAAPVLNAVLTDAGVPIAP